MDELDELRLKIAKMSGWTNIKIESAILRGEKWWNGIAPGRVMTDSVPDWPRDWNAAGKLLEEVVSDPMTSQSLIYYQSMKYWQCEIFTNRQMRNADGATAPEAICRAYLAWQEAVQQAAP
jgi:hypothetical protein